MNISTITNEEFYKLFDKKENVFFIQIGANDGISSDPIHNIVKEKKWSGVLFEPGKDAFKDLIRNYQGCENLIFVNSAVSSFNGKTKLFCGTTTPHFTLNEKKAVDMFDVVPTEVEVDVITPTSIINMYNIKNVDLLQIDAEGHDFTIIKSFPFERIKPKVIRFEYVNLNYDGIDTKEAVEFLYNLGYESYINKEEGDIISILNN